MLSSKVTIVVLFCYIYMLNGLSFLQAQTILTVGLSKYTTELRSIIEESGYVPQNVSYSDISAQSLENKTALTLFNLRQTWNQEQLFSQSQVEAILTFVREGGTLYLTSRKGYDNLLTPLGIEVIGVDGDQTGREWPLIETAITSFVAHPLTKQLSSIQTDVSGRFFSSSAWNVLGYSSNRIPLLAVRKWGLGKVILGSGERIFRDPRITSNRYETDIFQSSNRQYHLNLFAYLSQDLVPTSSDTPLGSQGKIHLFPNLTTGIVYVQGCDMHTIEIIATTGQILRTIPVSQNQLQINLHSLPKGFYWTRIHTATHTVSKKITLK